MTPLRDTTVAARVPLDLRTDLEAVVQRDREPDLTAVLRKALRRYADERLGRAPAGAGGLFAPAQGAARRRDRSTSTQAALDVAPRTGSQRRRALEVIAAMGINGATADEVIRALEQTGQRIAVNGVARRVTDLLQAGAIEPAPFIHDDGTPGVIARRTRNGSHATVYVITAKGTAWLQEAHNGR